MFKLDWNMIVNVNRFKKIFVVNCGEIVIRILRVVSELNLRIVVIYMYEDRYFFYCYKVDEVY